VITAVLVVSWDGSVASFCATNVVPSTDAASVPTTSTTLTVPNSIPGLRLVILILPMLVLVFLTLVMVVIAPVGRNDL
jgi:hypothetical protein